MEELNKQELINYSGGGIISNFFWDLVTYIITAPTAIEMNNAKGGAPVNYK